MVQESSKKENDSAHGGSWRHSSYLLRDYFLQKLSFLKWSLECIRVIGHLKAICRMNYVIIDTHSSSSITGSKKVVHLVELMVFLFYPKWTHFGLQIALFMWFLFARSLQSIFHVNFMFPTAFSPKSVLSFLCNERVFSLFCIPEKESLQMISVWKHSNVSFTLTFSPRNSKLSNSKLEYSTSFN